MNTAAVVDRLLERGLDPAERDRKRALFDPVLRAIEQMTGRAAEHVWWVPGRLEVFGKHTDYAGGRTLVAALPRGFAVAASARPDRCVRVIDARESEEVTLDTSVPGSFTGWRHYADVVVRRLTKNFPATRRGATIALASDLPAASGMSSSSALMIATATALIRVRNLDATDEWRANVHDLLDAAAYLACVENGKTFGTLAGDAGVGTHGGSEDHTAILLGRAGEVSAFSFVPPAPLGSARVPSDWRFVIAPSGVAAEKTGAARGSYNRLSAGISALLDLWNAHEAPAGALAAALRSRPDAEARLRGLAATTPVSEWTTAALERRLDHFVREDARILEAADAFARGDRAEVGRLALDSQRDAESLLGNQIPETVALAASAREHGAFAACSFGAGFGGSVWALADLRDATRIAAAWHPGAFVALPAPALMDANKSAAFSV
jgi:galactokinase